MTAQLKAKMAGIKTTYRVSQRVLVATVFFLLGAASGFGDENLEQQLAELGTEKLSRLVAERGDAERGALVFFQRELNCAKCHEPSGNANAAKLGKPLAPELASKRQVTLEHLVESLLQPSAKIHEGYETVLLQTEDGETVSGVLAGKDSESLQLMRIENPDEVESYSLDEVDWRIGKKSTMPEGLVNQLADQQQFFDLVQYLGEIAGQGPARALQLRPASAYVKLPPLPAYEQRIDHAGMIKGQDEDEEALERGEKIFSLHCASCHGTVTKEGSMPTSLRFAEGKFKNGADPHSMYKTLTHGYGMMNAQRWMVPQQKYDVIQFIRHEFLKQHNESQYVEVDDRYLAGLPAGDTRGPEPLDDEPWLQMDYGPSLINTIEVGDDGSNIAQKGIVVRLDEGPGGVASGRHWLMYEHDTLRVAAAWSNQFIDWNGIHFNGVHGQHPRVTGDVHFANQTGPGWARPEDESLEDNRVLGRDEKRYGPFANDWMHFRGVYRYGDRTILNYQVGNAEILESPSLEYANDSPVFVRQFNIGARELDLVMRVSGSISAESNSVRLEAGDRVAMTTEMVFAVSGAEESLKFEKRDSDLMLRIRAGESPIRFSVKHCPVEVNSTAAELKESIALDEPTLKLSLFTQGGPKNWPQVAETEITSDDNGGPFVVDYLNEPQENPWNCRCRLTGIDFLESGKSAFVTAWDGSVWRVDGIDQRAGKLRWYRIAAGLFQPLGVKIRDGELFVICRDQLVRLHDLNGDGEMDWYENFNSDHQVTEHFHEFAMGLQTDADGNFYYAKSARHARKAVVPHHGTLLKVSADGSETEIVANGFRAANGVCLNPDGTFYVTDQEGHWNPKNRINWVKPGGFYGNMYGYHDVTDASDEAMDPPMCWITNAFDRSPAELMWVDSDQWGPLRGALLNFSYGYGQIFVVPHETVNGQVQGGMCALPLPRLPTGIMRGRFHPQDGQLYCCGMFAWAGDQQRPGGFYRIRYTDKPVHLPTELVATTGGLKLKFSGPLDPDSIQDPGNYRIETWTIKRTKNYGSEHYDEQELKVEAVKLSADQQTIELSIPAIQPTRCMEIVYSFKSKTGKRIEGKIHNTIHELSDSK